MTDATTQNPFAPPRAHVHDHADAPQEMVTATRMSRFLAILIDGAPGFVIAIIAIIAAFSMMPGLLSGTFDPEHINFRAFGSIFLIVLLLSLAWVVWQIVLLYNYGQTVGKKVMGIRVVRMDGSRVSFARFFFLRGGVLLLVRAVVGGIGNVVMPPFGGSVAGWLIFLVDALVIFGAACRCVHDYIADTRVVTAESSPNATLAGSLLR